MEWSNLNLVAKTIVPLLSDDIIAEDLSDESGFVGAFTDDINVPFLDDKIFLMYDESKMTEASLNRYLKFEEITNIHSKRYVQINKKDFIIYAFNRINNRYIENILKGSNLIKTEDKISIYNFWRNIPGHCFNHELLYDSFRIGNDNKRTIPEEDYYPSLFEDTKENSLVVDNDRQAIFLFFYFKTISEQ